MPIPQFPIEPSAAPNLSSRVTSAGGSLDVLWGAEGCVLGAQGCDCYTRRTLDLATFAQLTRLSYARRISALCVSRHGFSALPVCLFFWVVYVQVCGPLTAATLCVALDTFQISTVPHRNSIVSFDRSNHSSFARRTSRLRCAFSTLALCASRRSLIQN